MICWSSPAWRQKPAQGAITAEQAGPPGFGPVVRAEIEAGAGFPSAFALIGTARAPFTRFADRKL